MLDESYKDLLGQYQENPPSGTWSAIEKSLHQPWYARPWSKVALISSFVAVSTLIIFLTFSKNYNTTTTDKINYKTDPSVQKEEAPILPGKNPESPLNSDKISLPEQKNQQQIPSYQSNAINDTQGIESKPDQKEAGNSNNSIPASQENSNKEQRNINAGLNTNSKSANTLSLKLSTSAICVGKVFNVKIAGAVANQILDFGDHHQLNLTAGSHNFPYTYLLPGSYTVTVRTENTILSSA